MKKEKAEGTRSSRLFSPNKYVSSPDNMKLFYFIFWSKSDFFFFTVIDV